MGGKGVEGQVVDGKVGAAAVCMCIICYFYTAPCGPGGHGSGRLFYMTRSCPKPLRVNRGRSNLLLP